MRCQINHKDFMLHRIIWLLMTEEDPGTMQIDHIDGDRLNNRWANLRLATNAQNVYNQKLQPRNTSGVKGVCWFKDARKWVVQIPAQGYKPYVGRFDSLEEATEVARRVREERHGEFANHGLTP